MKYLLKIVLLLLVCVFINWQCTEVVDIDLNTGENVHVVIEGSVTSEYKEHSVKISRTSDYFSSEPSPHVLNANVVISDSKNTYILTDTDNDGIYYSSKFAGIPGEDYTLRIELENGDVYTATDYLKPVLPMDSIVAAGPIKHPWYGEQGYQLFLYMQEEAGLGDAYIFDLFLNNELQTDTLRDKSFFSDLSTDGKYIRDIDVFWLSEDDLDEQKTEIKVLMSKVSQEYMDYIITLFLETDFRGGLFDGPAANIVGNISNDGLGYFEASAVDSLKIEINKLNLENR